MTALTTSQRDTLHLLLASDTAIQLAAMAQRLGLTPRQMQYSLRPIEIWLAQRGASLTKTPGVGVRVECTRVQRQTLLDALASERSFQLVLTAGQRQQLLAFQLLTASEPAILYQLQEAVGVSRTTILKDLDTIAAWMELFGIQIERRPNFGCRLIGPELALRQALAALLWGDVPFEDPLFTVSHLRGLVFLPFENSTLLPSLQRVADLVPQWDVRAAMQHVAAAEVTLGARFTDETVLQMSLAFAIQHERVGHGHVVRCDTATLRWLQSRPIWSAALALGELLFPRLDVEVLSHESAAIAMQLLSGSGERGSFQALVLDDTFEALIRALMQEIAARYGAPAIADDQTLRSGLEAHVIPACMRRRFGLWAPQTLLLADATDQWTHERGIADRLVAIVAERTGYGLPDSERHNLVLLVRAAAIRERPAHPEQVLVVCPSGMATTQLLVARLRVRFPHLGSFEVLSLRDLTAERIAAASLIITTTTLTLPPDAAIDVIQVHPLLRPADIEAIRTWIADNVENGPRLPA